MIDIVDLTCEIQNKMDIEISDQTLYLDFIQLRDVYNYLYQLKSAPVNASAIPKGKEELVQSTRNSPSGSLSKQGSNPTERTLLVFPGQGAQKVGMGRDLVKELPEAAKLFETAKEILGYDLLDVCLNGPEERLNSTVVAQPALYVVSMAAVEKLRKEDPNRIKNTIVVAGLSLGEYSALTFAGALTFEDGLRLVKARAEAMQEAANATSSGMVSVLGTSMTEQKVIELTTTVSKTTNSKCSIANLLCLGNIVVSGSVEACDEVLRVAESFGATKTVRLNVAGAFHSEFMRPAFHQLSSVLESVKISAPTIPVVFNVDAQTESDPQMIREKLLQQLVKPVLWERCMITCLRNYELAHAIEVGPGNVLTGIMRRILKTSDARIKPRPSSLSV